MTRRRTGRLRLAATCAAVAALSAPIVRGAGRSEVADAVMHRDRAALRALLQQKADVDAPQVDGATALHWAVYNDDLESLDLLLRAGAKVDAANRDGVTPLALASLYGNVPAIERLLKAGANAKQLGPSGETMIMLAARNGRPEAIRLLAAAGADVNARERLRGTTALMWAVEQRHPAAVKALLDLGADFSAKSGPAGLPRNYIAPKVNVAAVKEAAERYKRAAAAGRTYEEQLAYEAQQGLIGSGVRGFGNNAAGLPGGPQAGAAGAAPAPVQPGPSPQNGQQAAPARGHRGGARGGSPPAAGQGQAAGSGRGEAGGRPAAAPEEEDDADVIVAGLVGTGGGGLTPLVLAAREGDIESAELLLEAGADVNQTTEYGWSPLLTATNNRHYKLGVLLIEWGADVNLANKGGWTPLYLATDNRNIEGGDYPVPKPDMDHLEYIKILLEHGADPNARAKDNTLTRTIFTMQWFYEDGCTPFIRAAQSSDLELMKLLLDYGADPYAETNYGDTALTAAAGIGWVDGVTYEHSVKENLETIRFLLDLGLDPNAANHDGRTPLMGAALKGRNEVVQLLVDRGARLDQRDYGSRDTDKVASILAGHTWQALDYADGLVRVGVQSAVAHPETAALIRKLMTERGLPVPPPNRVVDSICVVELCRERTWK